MNTRNIADLHQIARSVGLAYTDKFDARSQRRRAARADRLAEGKARAAASRAATRNENALLAGKAIQKTKG